MLPEYPDAQAQGNSMQLLLSVEAIWKKKIKKQIWAKSQIA